MTSTAEAITTIRSFTEEQGVPMELAEVLVTEQVGLAGTGFDVEQRIHVPEVDERIVKDGVLTGVFACRAVIINPAESKIFINRPNVEDVTLIRARLTYDQLPSDLSEGGEVSHTAIYTLTGTDTKDIDEYYTASDSYATASRKRFEELSERFGQSVGSIMGGEQLPEQTPVSELLDLAAQADPETADGIFLNAVADGITDAQLDAHRLDDILNPDN